MNKFYTNSIGTGIVLSVIIISMGLSAPVHAGGASQHFSDALANSGQAIGHSMMGSLKLVSGVAAIPLLAIGEIGNASGEIGETLWEEANQPIGEPLTITDDVVTAGPSPAEAIKKKSNDEWKLR